MERRIQQRLAAIQERLLKLSIGGENVFHYWHTRKDTPYVIWAEDGPASYFDAGNHHAEISVHGTLDYFTKKEFDPVFDEIEKALTELFESRWRWTSTQYEDSTGLIHHEWEWNL